MLSHEEIDRALIRVRSSLDRYEALQRGVLTTDVRNDPAFQKLFNAFYKVRRDDQWRREFYELFESAKIDKPTFLELLSNLHKRTGRVEASFVSKLLASLQPESAVIDSVVLAHFQLRLPLRSSASRLVETDMVYRMLNRSMQESLNMEWGNYAVQRFRSEFPLSQASDLKVLDLVLWQAR